MSKLTSTLLSALIVCLLSGCSTRKNISPFPSISAQAKADLSSPVNCVTAENDIKVLESERISTAKQVLAGVRSILPIAAVAGILMGDYKDRVEVATGQYNLDLENKINYIKISCNIN